MSGLRLPRERGTWLRLWRSKAAGRRQIELFGTYFAASLQDAKFPLIGGEADSRASRLGGR